MSNHTPRIISPHALVEITCVVLQNRYLLRPSKEVNDLILGVLGEAQRKYEMRILFQHYLPMGASAAVWLRRTMPLAFWRES